MPTFAAERSSRRSAPTAPRSRSSTREILARAKVVVDSLEQCAGIGDLHHAIAAGLLTKADVHAELADLVDGRRPGRESADEVTVFDSTGTALEDVAAAAAVYEKALAAGVGTRFRFSG